MILYRVMILLVRKADQVTLEQLLGLIFAALVDTAVVSTSASSTTAVAILSGKLQGFASQTLAGDKIEGIVKVTN
jgi:hypothetical protein